MVIFVKLLHSLNTLLAITSTPSGIVMFVKFTQPLNAKHSIIFVFSLIIQLLISVLAAFINATYGLFSFPK